MSQQGGRPTGHEDDWWRQLYDDSTGDTGPAPARDSLDDRFASASGTVREGMRDGPEAGDAPPAAVPPPRRVPDGPPAPRPSGSPPPGPAPSGPAPSGPAPSGAAPSGGAAPPRAPWEPPPAAPPGPVTFPPTAATGPAGNPPATAGAPPPAPPPGASAPTPAAPAPPAPAPPGPPGAAPAPGHAPPAPQDPPGAASAAPPRETGAGDLPEYARENAPEYAPADTPAAAPAPPPVRGYVGTRPPTYDAEPTALPPAEPDALDDLVPDTVLDGARYGASTLRAASVRGDSARYRGEPRRDALLTARFGTGERALVLVAVATGARAAPRAHRAADEVCRWIGRAVGRSHARLVDDIRAARRGDLKSGLNRLTDRSLGRLRAHAVEQGLEPDAYQASLRCLLLTGDPECRTRVFFGVGPGGLFRLRDGEWQDIEPRVSDVRGEPVVGFGSPPAGTPDGDRLTLDLGLPAPPSPYEPAPTLVDRPEPPREPFRFRTSIARPGDALLMCSAGLADPMRGEEELRAHLAGRWSRPGPPGLAAFLADTQVRVKGYADDRTAAAVWEA
ncbi:protein phosphatase 2C domain-containing protein [Streptomyces sp. enrichment culture]|uniref:protein phosphatase 2C domain-containing protein n=1 Tax=Streptomyces sp. enrichment culture TaxID=1795815 RepID=UPI003F57400B